MFNLQPFMHEVLKKKINCLAVTVRQHNEILNSFSWNDAYTRDRCNVNSISKSVTSLAIGIAQEEGLLKITDRVIDYFPEDVPDPMPKYLDELTIQHLLTMTAGYGKNTLPRPARDLLEDPNWVKYIFSQEIVYKPGTFFVYDNGCTFLCSKIIEKQSGQTMLNYLKPRLFTPLGIMNPQWFTSPLGTSLGCSGLHLDTKELTEIGQVCLDGGRWKGAQLVPEAYVKEATSPHSVAHYQYHKTPQKDFCGGYGYFFWMNETVPGYRGFGNFGQEMIVLPQYDAVVGIAAFDPDDQGILDAVWEGIIPVFESQGI